MKPPINPEEDFAGFVEERLLWAIRQSSSGRSIARIALRTGSLNAAGPDDIDAIESLARYFDRAASEIRDIAKAIRRKHGITAEDEHQRGLKTVEKQRTNT